MTQDAIRDVYVVPNFISEGYFTRTVIPRELGLDDSAPLTVRADTGQRWHYCAPVGNHPSMTDLLLRRAREVAPGVPEAETSLLIVGHGTGLNDNSAVAAKQQVELIRARGDYAAVLNTYMEEPPLIADWAKLTDTPNVVVVPFFISDGLHSYQDIPVLLGIETETTASASERLRAGGVFMQNPRHVHGRALYYASAIGTEAQFADVIVEQAAAALRVMNGEDVAAGTDSRAPSAGRRRTNCATATTPRPGAELTPHTDPEDAAALALYDDAGPIVRSRPRRTCATAGG